MKGDSFLHQDPSRLCILVFGFDFGVTPGSGQGLFLGFKATLVGLR